jgi:hypothetical protein
VRPLRPLLVALRRPAPFRPLSEERRASLVRLLGLALVLSVARPRFAEAQFKEAERDKARLQARFQLLKSRYLEVKVASARYRPLKASDPTELIQARSELSATMASYEQLEGEAQALHNKLAQVGSLSEMGETESLRLQMTMDRLSKMMETLSNLMKKISDTGDSVIQNMK